MLCRNEALAGLSNVGAYTALALPVFLGPGAYIGDILTIMISTAGVALAALTSAVENGVAMISGLLAGVLGVWEMIAGVAGSGGEIVSEALGVVQDGVQGALETAEKEPVLAATATGVAYGATRSMLDGRTSSDSKTHADKLALSREQTPDQPTSDKPGFDLLRLLGLRSSGGHSQAHAFDLESAVRVWSREALPSSANSNVVRSQFERAIEIETVSNGRQVDMTGSAGSWVQSVIAPVTWIWSDLVYRRTPSLVEGTDDAAISAPRSTPASQDAPLPWASTPEESSSNKPVPSPRHYVSPRAGDGAQTAAGASERQRAAIFHLPEAAASVASEDRALLGQGASLFFEHGVGGDHNQNLSPRRPEGNQNLSPRRSEGNQNSPRRSTGKGGPP